MSAPQFEDEGRKPDDALEDIQRVDPMLALLAAVGQRDLKMDPSLALAMQELYEDLANTYMTLSETLRAYVIEQRARGAVLSSKTDASQGVAGRYSS